MTEFDRRVLDKKLMEMTSPTILLILTMIVIIVGFSMWNQNLSIDNSNAVDDIKITTYDDLNATAVPRVEVLPLSIEEPTDTSRIKFSELSLEAHELLKNAGVAIGLNVSSDLTFDRLSVSQFEGVLKQLRNQYSAAEDEVIREQANIIEQAERERKYKDYPSDEEGCKAMDIELLKIDGLHRIPATGTMEGPDGSPITYQRIYIVDLTRYPAYRYSLEYLESFKEFIPYLEQQATRIINR